MIEEGLYLRVVELVKKGWSYRDVGREVGISHGKVGYIMESNEVAERLHGDLLKIKKEIERLRGKREECVELYREAEQVADEKVRRVEELLGKEHELVNTIRGFLMKQEYYGERYNEVKRLEERTRSEILKIREEKERKVKKLEALDREIKAKEGDREKLEQILKEKEKEFKELAQKAKQEIEKKGLEMFRQFPQEMRIRMLCTLSDDELMELIEMVRKERWLPLSWWVSSQLDGIGKKKEINSSLANQRF